MHIVLFVTFKTVRSDNSPGWGLKWLCSISLPLLYPRKAHVFLGKNSLVWLLYKADTKASIKNWFGDFQSVKAVLNLLFIFAYLYMPEATICILQ